MLSGKPTSTALVDKFAWENVKLFSKRNMISCRPKSSPAILSTSFCWYKANKPDKLLENSEDIATLITFWSVLIRLTSQNKSARFI